MNIKKLQVGDVVVYRVSSSRTDRRISQARITALDLEANQVTLIRRDGNSVVRMVFSAARVKRKLDDAV